MWLRPTKVSSTHFSVRKSSMIGQYDKHVLSSHLIQVNATFLENRFIAFGTPLTSTSHCGDLIKWCLTFWAFSLLHSYLLRIQSIISKSVMAAAIVKIQVMVYLSRGYLNSMIRAASLTFFMNLSPVQYPSCSAPYSRRARASTRNSGSVDWARAYSEWSMKSLAMMPEPFDFGRNTAISSTVHIHSCPSLLLKIDSSWYMSTSLFIDSASGEGVTALSSLRVGGGRWVSISCLSC